MTAKSIVFDVSRYQGNINFAKARALGILGVAIRGTVGDYYQDPNLTANWDGAGMQGLARTIYHVVTPEISAVAQITNLFKAAGSRRPAWPYVIDCELTRDQNSDKITSVIQKCCSEIERIDGRKPIIYTRQSWWDYYVLPWSHWKDYPLWAARYINGLLNPWWDGACKFRDWTNWLLWQWSADGNGLGAAYGCDGSKSVDLDIFNGTDADFLSLCGVTVAPTPPPTPTPTPTPAMLVFPTLPCASVLTDTLNIHILPDYTSKVTGYLLHGNNPAVMGIKVDPDGNIWAQVGWQSWCAFEYKKVRYLKWVA